MHQNQPCTCTYPKHLYFVRSIRKGSWPPSPGPSRRNPSQHLGPPFPAPGLVVGNAGGAKSPPSISDIVQLSEMGGGITGLAPATVAPRHPALQSQVHMQPGDATSTTGWIVAPIPILQIPNFLCSRVRRCQLCTLCYVGKLSKIINYLFSVLALHKKICTNGPFTACGRHNDGYLVTWDQCMHIG